ncbi:MAG: prepilin peptidase [Dehalococcoidales bacterium]|nr:MAG: prepilin peptidase [Dehalococcoidales bacterium]
MLPLFILLGVVVGSFLNVCIDRLPERQSLFRPRSHCPVCQHRLAISDLIPLFSYLWLRRRCRYCGAPIPQRLFWVELVTALLFAFLWCSYGPGVQLGILLAYGCLFIVIFVIDLERGLILNRLVYPAALLTLALVPLRPELTIVNSLIGGGIGLALLLLPVIVFRGGIGWGDVKMAGLIGLATGSPVVFTAIISAIIVGGLIAGILLLLSVKKRGDTIPFGPFLCLGAMAGLLWGSTIYDWYIGLFS